MPAAAGLGIGAIIAIVVGSILALVLLVCLIHDYGKRILLWWKPAPCGLRSYWLLPNKCAGPCPTAGQICIAIGTDSYFLFGTQDLQCNCGAPGTGAWGGTGSPISSAVQQAKKQIEATTDEHNKAVNKAIDDSH